YKKSVAEVLYKALSGEETANYEFPLYTKGGEQLHVLLNSTTRRDANGQIVGVVGVGQDITALKNIQREIIQSSKLATLGEMATAVAHELNQPLNTIRFATSNLNDAIELGQLTQEILKSKLDRVESQVKRASSIIDHMRIFGRATADESPEPVCPSAAVAGAMDLMGEQLRLANINVIKEFTDDKAQILGHSILLEQVVLNLLANARDQFRHNDSIKKKEIRLVVRKQAGSVVQIEVSDTGGGMPESVIGRIFEPFYTTKRAGEGTGLGLSLSYGIVRDMGGTLSVQNSGDGAAFIISLPLLEDLAA
ncbi:MAG: PAS domain S-box protein, partial [Gammaproteobacteria bacterium]|nr:PAS domain S-box protein [Gammaproteobacteria bacterium]